MKKSNTEKAQWILNGIDSSGFLGREILDGKVYVSDAMTGRRYLYNPNDPDHQDFKSVVDHIHNMAKHIDKTMVYHIVVSKFVIASSECYTVNYLYISESDVYYEDNWNRNGMVMSYVNNLTWDIQEHGSIGLRMYGELIRRVS